MDLKCWQALYPLITIVNSLLKDRFKQFVREKIAENNNRVDDKNGNKFPVLPAIAKAFADSEFVSSNILM